jgi:type I restriction enzyme M protein
MKPTLWALADLLRGQFAANQAALLLLRIATWVKLSAANQLPVRLRADPKRSGMSGRHLIEVFFKLAEEAPPPATFLFTSLQDREYSTLSEHQVSALVERTWLALESGGIDQGEFDEIVHRSLISDRGALGGPAPQVADILIDLAQPGKGEPIPCLGKASEFVAIAAMRRGHPAILRAETHPTWAAAYAVLFDCSLDVIVTDPLEMTLGLTDRKLPYRIAIGSPPFGVKHDVMSHPRWMQSRFGLRFAHSLYIEMMLNSVTERIVAVVPNSFLFARGSEARFREELALSARLASVLSFPPGLVLGASIPFSAIVVEPRRTARTILMCKVDESHTAKEGKERVRVRRLIARDAVLDLIKHPRPPFARTVSAEEAASQEFVLTPERYLAVQKSPEIRLPPRFQAVRLGDLASSLRPQAWPDAKSGRAVQIREIGVGELPEYGYIGQPVRERTVDIDVLNRRQKHVLMAGDVLISTKGSVGKTGIVGQPDAEDIPRVASQSFLVLRLERGAQIVDPIVLFMLLRAPSVQSALASVTSASTVPVIQARDIENLLMPILSPDEQHRLIELFNRQVSIQDEIARLRAQQRNVANEVWMSFSG